MEHRSRPLFERDTFLEKYRLEVGICLVLAVLVGGGVLAFFGSRPQPPAIEKIVSEANESTASATPTAVERKIKVDIAGAVVSPGVYEVFEEDRVADALSAAGGLSELADRDWVNKKLNLAAKLYDGDKLYIPQVGENPQTNDAAVSAPERGTGVVSGAGSSAASDCSRVNINTASATTLADCLPGIGATKAQNIIKYREEHGGFKVIEEIKNVSGIAEGTFAKIKDQITVD